MDSPTCYGLSASRKGFTSAFSKATSSGVTLSVQMHAPSRLIASMNSSIGALTDMRWKLGLDIGTILTE